MLTNDAQLVRGVGFTIYSSGVAARSLQDALIWLSGLTPKKTAWWGWEDSNF